MHRAVGEQSETGDEVSFPKPSKSFVGVDEKEALPETSLAVKGAHLTFDFDDFQRRRDRLTEDARKTDTRKALRTRQSLVFFNCCHFESRVLDDHSGAMETSCLRAQPALSMALERIPTASSRSQQCCCCVKHVILVSGCVVQQQTARWGYFASRV